MTLRLQTAVRLAWRDLQFSWLRAGLAVLAIAVGTSTIAAVLFLNVEMRSKLHGNAREWIAADIAVRLHEAPSPEESAALEPLLQQGFEQTLVRESYAMTASANAPDAVLTYIKIVDPAHYPFFGSVKLLSRDSLQTALQDRSVVVSRDLLDRLQLKIGDLIRMGGTSFKVASTIESEPDWSAGVSTALPRILLSSTTFERAGLARSTDNQSYRLLFRLPPGSIAQSESDTFVREARQQLERIFPYAEVLDYRDPDPSAAASFAAAGRFLQFAAGLVLLIGASALLLLTHLRMQSRLDSIAIMKAVGGQSRAILAIYVTQICGCGLAGGIAGGLVSPFVARLFAWAANLYLPLDLIGEWHWWGMGAACLSGGVAALPAVWIAVFRIREARPMMVLRRHASASSRDGQSFAIPLPHSCPVALRIAARNVFRRGHHSFAMLLLLTGGVAILGGTYICQRRLSETIVQAIPAHGSDLYLIGLEKNRLEEAGRWLAEQPDVDGAPQTFPFVWLRLSTINGQPPASVREQWLVTCADNVPPGSILLPGSGVTGVKLGDALIFTSKDQVLEGHVTGTRADELDDIISAITFPCASLKGLSLFYHAAVRVHSGREESLRRALSAKFPALPTLSRHEFTAFVQHAAGQAIVMMQLVSWAMFAIVLALQAILVIAVQRSMREETAILRALGAGRGFLRTSTFYQYALLGFFAAAIGIVLASALSSLLLTIILRRVMFVFDLQITLAAMVWTPLLAGFVASAATLRQYRRTPLHVLRDQ